MKQSEFRKQMNKRCAKLRQAYRRGRDAGLEGRAEPPCLYGDDTLQGEVERGFDDGVTERYHTLFTSLK